MAALNHRQKRAIDRARRHGVHAAYAEAIMRSTSRYQHVGFALGLALIQQESGFRNVFGHDPTSSIPRSWMGTLVTRAKYRVYRAARKLGRGMQGVGPGQLTWYETQDLADQRGGCWRREINIDVAIATLAARIRDYGYADGIRRYNGSGPAAERYSREVRARAAAWRRTLN
jgi:hypothetical protein